MTKHVETIQSRTQSQQPPRGSSSERSFLRSEQLDGCERSHRSMVQSTLCLQYLSWMTSSIVVTSKMSSGAEIWWKTMVGISFLPTCDGWRLDEPATPHSASLKRWRDKRTTHGWYPRVGSRAVWPSMHCSSPTTRRRATSCCRGPEYPRIGECTNGVLRYSHASFGDDA